jgi:hypothetical protein
MRSIAATACASPFSARTVSPIAAARSRMAPSSSAVLIATAGASAVMARCGSDSGEAARGKEAGPGELVNNERRDNGGLAGSQRGTCRAGPAVMDDGRHARETAGRALSEQILGLSPAVLASAHEQSVPIF